MVFSPARAARETMRAPLGVVLDLKPGQRSDCLCMDCRTPHLTRFGFSFSRMSYIPWRKVSKSVERFLTVGANRIYSSQTGS